MSGLEKRKKWSAPDVFWLGAGIVLGLFLVVVGYLFVQLWAHSTLRQLFFGLTRPRAFPMG